MDYNFSLTRREDALLKKLTETGYQGFEDKGRTLEKRKEAALQDINDCIRALAKHMEGVIKQQTVMVLHEASGETPEGIREMKEGIRRRNEETLKAATRAMDELNLIAAACGAEPFADIDTSDPMKVEAMIGKMMMSAYMDEILIPCA